MAALPTEVKDLTGDDLEEDKLQTHLQRVLRSCVESLGVNLTIHREKIETPESPQPPEEEERGQHKRPRSLEPFAAPSIATLSKEAKDSKQLDGKKPDAPM
eukprot:s180_g40.t1